jgi:nucleotide-binding universal stress UspA family protein
MARPVTVGLDGSPESFVAADWAGREARARHTVLRLVNAWAVPDLSPGKEAAWHRWSERALHTAESELTAKYPDLRISTEQIPGRPGEVLLAEAGRAQLLVLGSSGFGQVSGFFMGSVGLELAARAATPTVLVRADPGDAEIRDIVVGLGLRRPCDRVLEFAFEAAALHGATLRAVHASRIPAVWNYAPWIVDAYVREAREATVRALSEALEPCRKKFPEVRVSEELSFDNPSHRLVDMAPEAALMVVGRGPRGSVLSARLGPVAHAVVHHAACPVAVVPHD